MQQGGKQSHITIESSEYNFSLIFRLFISESSDFFDETSKKPVNV